MSSPRIIPLFFIITAAVFSSFSADTREPADAVIIISDSGCNCTSPAETVFDCKKFNRSLNISGRRSIQRGNRFSTGLNAIRDKVAAYLDSSGYLHVKWEQPGASVIKAYPRERSVLFREEIRYPGSPPDTLCSVMPSFPYPRPFSISLINGRTAALARSFMQCGYPFVKISTALEAPSSPDSLLVVFSIDPDSLCFFDAPILKGTFTVGQTLLLHDIVFIPGRRYAADAVERSLIRLRSRRYIAAATAEPPLVVPDSASGISGGNRVTVPFVINDRSGMGLDGAVGLEIRQSEKPQMHGNLEFSFLNMFRAGEEASLNYTGDRDRQRLDVDVEYPWLFGYPVILSLAGGLEIEQEAYGYLYGSVTALYETAAWWRIGTRFTGNSITGNSVENWTDGSYAGADLVLVREHEPFTDGELSRSLYIATGSGVTHKDRRYTRSHVDFSAMAHLPLPMRHQALLVRGVTGHIISREESMLAAEMYRVGGNWSLRGYSEDEFAFRTVLRGQSEYLYYFQKNASVYLLCDGGIGFPGGIDHDRSFTSMLGYGAGMRIPVATGTLSIAWARSIADRRSPGRIHVRLQNALSSSAAKGVSLSGR